MTISEGLLQGDLHRLKTICRWCSRISTLALIGGLVILVLMIAALVLSIIDPTLIDYTRLDIVRIPNELTQEDFLVVCTLDSLMLALGLFMGYILRNIFHSISQEYTPFTNDNYRRLLYMTFGIALSWLFFPLQHLLGYNVDLISDSVTRWIVVILVYALALVFRYGQFLQKESDETL